MLAGVAAVLHCSRVERLFATSATSGERTAVRQAGYPASVVDVITWRTVPSSSFAITFTGVEPRRPYASTESYTRPFTHHSDVLIRYTY